MTTSYLANRLRTTLDTFSRTFGADPALIDWMTCATRALTVPESDEVDDKGNRRTYLSEEEEL